MSRQMTEFQVDGPEWYCARTQPKREHIAAANVIKKLGLEVFHPRLRLERSTRRGPVNVIEPLFPCYIFVRCRLEESLDHVRHINGISSLVHFGTKTPNVPDQVIEELRQCFDSEELMTVDDSLFVGAEVTVADGALLGSRGIVVRFLPARQRVQILLDFLGRTTLAELDRKSLTLEDKCVADLMPALAASLRTKVAVAA